MNHSAFIAKLPLFSGLTEEHLAAVSSIAVPLSFRKGQTIFLEGAAARGFYVVRKGQVKIFKLSPEGREQIIHVYGPGETFAEVPVFENGRFPAHAEATAKTELLSFSREDLLRLMQKDAGIGLNMLAVMAHKLRRFTIQLERLTLRETPQRLAAYLLDVSVRSGGETSIELDISKGHLASLLGTAPETLSRILRRMNDAGLLSVQGRQIRIVQADQLEALASGEERL